jgi:hypothetical protein
MNDNGKILDQSLLIIIHVQIALIMSNFQQKFNEIGEQCTQDVQCICSEFSWVMCKLLLIEESDERGDI